jgi:hypothetical protein
LQLSVETLKSLGKYLAGDRVVRHPAHQRSPLSKATAKRLHLASDGERQSPKPFAFVNFDILYERGQ